MSSLKNYCIHQDAERRFYGMNRNALNYIHIYYTSVNRGIKGILQKKLMKCSGSAVKQSKYPLMEDIKKYII